MIMDKEALLSGTVATATGVITGQAITATAVSTNTYDLGVARDIGAGEELEYFIKSGVVFNTLTSLTIDLITSASADLSTPTVLQSHSRTLAQLAVDSVQVRGRIPLGGAQRYLGFRYTVVGTNPTTGTIVAGIVLDQQAAIL